MIVYIIICRCVSVCFVYVRDNNTDIPYLPPFRMGRCVYVCMCVCVCG